MQTIRKGSTGEDVRTAQTMLNLAGFITGIDGIFGSATDSAVRAFQSKYGLVVDGIVGSNTWNALSAVTTQPLTVSPIPSPMTGTTPSGTIPIPMPSPILIPSTIPTTNQAISVTQPTNKNTMWLYVAIGAMIWYFQQKKEGTMTATA